MTHETFANTTAFFDDWALDDVFSGTKAFTAEKKRLLVVEDDYLLAEMLGTELENFGFTTQTAISADEVELISEEASPDVIISDFYLPKTNGLDLIKTLQKKELFKETIFLLMSGSTEAKQLAREADVGFVEKPFNLDQILAEIEHQTKDAEVTYSLKNNIAKIQQTGFGKRVKEYLFG